MTGALIDVCLVQFGKDAVGDQRLDGLSADLSRQHQPQPPKQAAPTLHSARSARWINQAPKYIIQRVKLEQSWRDTQAKTLSEAN